ncbi:MULTISPECIES: ATP-binding cassette domain-containing protein [Microbacterium]|uniref:ATP-binding cassette domain-containing protein n=1 Tax=Microbacterium galbinum TaxID=2851646 RepID=A0ABY4ITX9_9MICO|nr:ATP-binding cassette domain-containing protein [Microbacterium galbinum]UPL16158.1 ATP-binding cassette domain-containing protein [Microbacterium galbinum]
MITSHHLTKRYGEKTVVDNLTFTVRPGVVTGFLGPNGAGKSTTMRMLVGLDRPTDGRITVGGRRYQDLPDPIRHLGVMLDARAVNPGRTALNHLLVVAETHNIARARAIEVLEMVGLGAVANKRAGGFSLGMSQRLGIATALLGDPATLVLDEPVNGLDPDGVLWLRHLLVRLAAEGRTVFLSSHLMSELSLIAKDLVVIGQGRLLAAGTVEDVIESVAPETTRVVSPDASRLADVIQRSGVEVRRSGEDTLFISGFSAREVGHIAAGQGATLYALSAERASLEEAFMQITRNAVEYSSQEEAAA